MSSATSPQSDHTSTPSPVIPKLLVDAKTAAGMLGISVRSLWTISFRGGIPSLKIGARRLYSVESLRRWVAERETANAGGASQGRREPLSSSVDEKRAGR